MLLLGARVAVADAVARRPLRELQPGAATPPPIDLEALRPSSSVKINATLVFTDSEAARSGTEEQQQAQQQAQQQEQQQEQQEQLREEVRYEGDRRRNRPMVVAGIPKLLWQTTYLDPTRVPTRSLLGEHAAGYEHTTADDAACEAFIAAHFPRAVDAFRALSGAHRADLWRYCVLYVHGGVYLDIKTVLRQPLDVLFPSRDDKFTWHTVVCNNKKCIYNGIIATPPKNPIFLRLIDYIVAHAPPSRYHSYVDYFKRVIEERYGAEVRDEAVFEDAETRVILRAEVCSDAECAYTPKKAKDRYGYCCNIHDRLIDPSLWPVITVRDADYPWNATLPLHLSLHT